jgi:DNA-binding LytR/AlgR family response regulator
MTAIIIEDEKLSAEHLCNILNKTGHPVQVVAIFDSVKQTIDAFNSGIRADLLFVDIQLGDGLSFEIFSETAIDTPIIFTTAYNEYSIRAFKLNSIDYLLKPIGLADLKNALDKFLKYGRKELPFRFDQLGELMQLMQKPWKRRFMVRLGENILSVKEEDISHFIFEDGIVLLNTRLINQYPLDFTLDQVESMVDPARFFRINRKVIINIDYVQKTGTYFNSRLKITASQLHPDHAIVSRERVNGFKTWLGL